MKRICALIVVAALLAGCATSDPVANVRPLQQTPATTELRDEAPARTVQWAPPRHRISIHDPMPFGDSMFGPWRTGLEPDASVPRPTGRLTVDPRPVDLVNMPLHTVLYFIAARAGADLWIGPHVPNPRVTVFFRDVDPREAVLSLCKANKLDFFEEGNAWMIWSRPAGDPPVHVTKGDLDGYYHVDFNDHEMIAAIMEVAQVAGAQVLIPSFAQRADDEEDEACVRDVQEQRITLKARNATPDYILRELARLGGMDIEVIVVEGDQPAYKFKYR